MKTDYKFWYIKRDDNGFITEVAVRFYEGEVVEESILNKAKNETETVVVYRRNKRLKVTDLEHLSRDYLLKDNQSGTPFIKEQSGEDAILYIQRDFGQIKSDEELCLFLNKELAKDKSREPVDEQKCLA